MELTPLQMKRFRYRTLDILCFRLNSVRCFDDTEDETDYSLGFGITTQGTPKDDKKYQEHLEQAKKYAQENKNLNFKWSEIENHFIKVYSLTKKQRDYIRKLYEAIK